jgi:hypothetical protein
MKILLGVSLILNVILGVLYFQQKNQPPIERIIMEHSAFKETPKNIIIDETKKMPHAKAAMMVNTQDANTEEPPIIVQDEQTFIQASEELLRAQHDYLEELEISDKDIKRKTKLTNDFFHQSGLLQKKTPFGQRMPFEDRRSEIDLEEKLHRDYAKLLGNQKWQQYRKWVDNYNQNLIKNHKSKEFSPLMMSY